MNSLYNICYTETWDLVRSNFLNDLINEVDDIISASTRVNIYVYLKEQVFDEKIIGGGPSAKSVIESYFEKGTFL